MQLSVVIPLYNKASTVARSIRSVLSQKYHDFELILVDDGSTDSSLAKVEEFDDRRLKIVSQENKGVSAARNHGVDVAVNSFVCFLDADDEWKPDFLSAIASLIKSNPDAGIYTCRYSEIDEQGNPFIGKTVLPEKFAGEVTEFFRTFAQSRSFICSSNICFNRKYLREIGGFPVRAKVGEDIYVWLRLALLAPVMHDSRVLSVIHRDAENRTSSRLKPLMPFHIMFFFNVDDSGDDSYLRTNEALRTFLFKNGLLFAADAAMRGDRKLARNYSRLFMTHNIRYAIAIFFLSYTPSFLIETIRYLRNKWSTRSV